MPPDLTPAELDAIEARAERATPSERERLLAIAERWSKAPLGPWRTAYELDTNGICHGAPTIHDTEHSEGFIARMWKRLPGKVETAEAIAAAPDDIEWMIALCHMLLDDADQLRAAWEERDRFAKLVEKAYIEGWFAAKRVRDIEFPDGYWLKSDARRALTPPGEGETDA